jgi:hypothetical protein
METPQRKRQRIRDRIPCNLDVFINDSLTCSAFDISEGGLYIKTGDVFAPGTVVKLSLPFRGDRLEVSARIKYCLEGVGIGLMFIDLDDMLKGRIKALLKDIKDSTC